MVSRIGGAAIIGYLAVSPFGRVWLSWTMAIALVVAVLLWSAASGRRGKAPCVGTCPSPASDHRRLVATRR